MKHIYSITGMTCKGCKEKVQHSLSQIIGVIKVNVDLQKGEAEIEMDKHISTETLKASLKNYPQYQLAEKHAAHMIVQETEESKYWIKTYKPILLIFAYITILSIIAGSNENNFDEMKAMRIFMSGFFLSFSFFKLLDLNGFADSYSTYDIIAKRIRQWGFFYAFIELVLGISFAMNFQPVLTNLITFIVMSVSIIGVLQSVLNKRKIRCACLGAVFNLPMSTVTIIEDALMILMSGIMLFLLF